MKKFNRKFTKILLCFACVVSLGLGAAFLATNDVKQNMNQNEVQQSVAQFQNNTNGLHATKTSSSNVTGNGYSGTIGQVAPSVEPDNGIPQKGLNNVDGLIVSATGTWQDSFETAYTTAEAETAAEKYAVLAALDVDAGNFFKIEGQGNGASTLTPYIINTTEQLAFLGALCDIRQNSASNPTGFNINGAHFKIVADGDELDFSGKEWVPIFNFNYTYGVVMNMDCNNTTFTKVFIDDENGTNYSSIFGCWPQGTISNLTVTSANIKSTTRAGVVNISSNTSNPTIFSNITIENCRVLGVEYAVGISDNAQEFTNCKVSNSEIIVDNIKNAFSMDLNYALGFGVSYKATGDSENINAYGLFNSIVKVSNTYENYARPTANVGRDFNNNLNSRNFANYACGIALYTTNANYDIEYSYLTVSNSDILASYNFKNSNVSSVSSYLINCQNIATGVGFYNCGGNSDIEGSIHDIALDNSRIESECQFGQETVEIGQFAPNFGVRYTGFALGAGYMNAPNGTFENIVVTDCSIIGTSLANYDTPQTTSNGIYFNNNVAGIAYSSVAGYEFNNCSLQDCEVDSTSTINICDGSAFSIASNYIRAAGISTCTTSNYFPSSHINCKVQNSEISSTTNIDNGSSSYNNSVAASANTYGGGIGSFTNFLLKNTSVIANANGTRADGETSTFDNQAWAFGIGRASDNRNCDLLGVRVDACLISARAEDGNAYAVGMVYNNTGACQGLNFRDYTVSDVTVNTSLTDTQVLATGSTGAIAVGMGYNTGALSTGAGFNFESCLVSNAEIKSEVTGATGAGISIGMGYNTGAANGGNSYTNCDVENSDIIVLGKSGNNYAVGMGYNGSGALVGGTHNFTSCTLGGTNGVTIDVETPTGYIYTAGFSHNTGAQAVNSIFENCSTNKLTIRAISPLAEKWVAGFQYRYSTTSGSNDFINCSAVESTIYASDLDESLYMDSNGTLLPGQETAYAEVLATCRSNAYVSGMGLNRGNINTSLDTGNDYINCSIINSYMRATSSYTGGAYASGLNYNTGTIAGGQDFVNCDVTGCNVETYSRTGLGTGNNCYSTAMSYNSSNTQVRVNDCTSTGNNVSAIADNENAYASGMSWTTMDSYSQQGYRGYIEDCITDNNTVFAQTKDTSGKQAIAVGLAGQYINTIESSIVGSGDITALSNNGDAFAFGVGVTFGIDVTGARDRSTDYDETPITFIISCYNFANIKAETTSRSRLAYSAGIGQAESFDRCYNEGNVIGNYAGGITSGHSRSGLGGNNYRDRGYSRILVMKNCTNAGDIAKSNNGGSPSYIGGLCGVYNCDYIRDRSFILENNVSVGGVYSGYINDTYEQEVSQVCYLGSLYGYLYAYTYNITASTVTDVETPTGNYLEQLNDFSIKNNYSLIDAENNGGLQLTNPTVDAITNIEYLVDAPEDYRIRLTDGVLATSFNSSYSHIINGHKAWEDVIRDLYANSATFNDTPINTNHIINSEYNTNTFDRTALSTDLRGYALANNWENFDCANSKYPQVQNVLNYQMMSFDNNDLDFTKVGAKVVEILTSYVRSGEGPYIYTQATAYDAENTYHALYAITEYLVTEENVASYYTRTGSEGSFVYTPATVYDSDETYYSLTTNAIGNAYRYVQFVAPTTTLDQTGMSVGEWTTKSEGTYDIGTNYLIAKNNSPVLTLYAKSDYTEYTVVITETGINANETVNSTVVNGKNDTQIVTLETTSAYISTVYALATVDEHNVNAPQSVNWSRNPKNTGVLQTIYRTAYSERAVDNAGSAVLNLGSLLTPEFLDANAYQVGDIWYIKINAEYVNTIIHAVTVTYDDSEGYEDFSRFTVVVTGNSSALVANENNLTNKKYNVVEGQSLAINTTANRHYEFVSYEILYNGESSSNTNINATIPNIEHDINITVRVRKIAYSLEVICQNLSNYSYDESLVNTLIAPYNSERISVDEALPSLEALNVEGYKFLGWKLVGSSEYLNRTPDTYDGEGNVLTYTNSIAPNIIISESDFIRYLDGELFQIIAVFQKQFNFTFVMDNPEGLNSDYLISYRDSEDVVHTIDSTQGEYDGTVQLTLDEKTFVTIEVTPNRRVNLTGITPANTYHSGNLIFVDMDDNKTIFAVFTEKSAYSVVVILKDQKNEEITDYDVAELITTTLPTISPAGEDIALPRLAALAQTDDETMNASNTGYRFLRWELKNGDAIATTGTTIDAGFKEASGVDGNGATTYTYTNMMTEEEFYGYADNENAQFVLVAVFQRQYRLTFGMENEEGLNSNYIISYTDSENVLQSLDSTQGEYQEEIQLTLDEKTFVTIQVVPNPRVNLTRITPDSTYYSGNLIFVDMDDNKAIVAVFTEKSAYSVVVILKDQKNEEITDYEVAELIETALPTIRPAGTDIALPILTAVDHVIDASNIGYRFLRWELKNGDVVATTGTTIDAVSSNEMTEEEFYGYADNENAQFVLVAVFQRQYRLTVSMINTFGEAFNSNFEFRYTDANNIERVVSSQEPSYATTKNDIIDEGILVEINVLPNPRVNANAPRITNVEPEKTIKFSGNIGYVSMDSAKEIELTFSIRSLTVRLEAKSVATPTANMDENYTNSLIGAIKYTVTKASDGSIVHSDSNNPVFDINDTVVITMDKAFLSNAVYRGLELYILNVNTNEYVAIKSDASIYNATTGAIAINNDFYDDYVPTSGQVTLCLKAIKQYVVAISGANMTSGDYTLGSYTISIKAEDGATDAGVERYTQVADKENTYIADNGIKFIITPTVGKYSKLTGYSGLFEDETANNSGVITVTSSADRSVSVRFEKEVYEFLVDANAEAKGELSYTNKFSIGDTISISYTPENNYQIRDWAISSADLEKLGAVQTGNTIEIVVTDTVLDYLSQVGLLSGHKVSMTNEIKTMMNPTLFYGVIGGGAVVIILFALVLFLVLRSNKLKKQKEENERKLNDIARKFNIADMISDLKK